MGRQPCCAKEGLNRGAWTAHEDQMLVSYIKAHGEGKWRSLPKRAGLNRCGKSCRLRWLNYLRPGIKRGNISDDEEELIIRLHKLLGNRWSLIAGRLPGRTDNEIKNYWNTTLMKKVQGSEYQPAKPSPNGSMADPALVRGKAEGDAAVAQTKAHRCTKSFYYHQDQALIPSSTDQQHLGLESKEFKSSSEAPHGHSSLDVPTKVPLRVGEEDEDPCFSMSLDSRLFFDGPSMEDWTEDIEFNLTSVASFLDAEEEWLNWSLNH